ncbi:YdcF family protein [Cloacibacillus sp. An23]|uniref:YdcF family protein n=1 Tax=Cloacibacillus sp. An23 TaxID=1965591 RepID=UPI000B3A606D|nr:YdcF family protein [Cloacibacillus sp. An23]OUO94063.1 hypothetical protein B5F39_05195 [Cloacibacillus sp. An23]
MFLLYKFVGSLVVPPGCFIVAILVIAALALRKPRKPVLAGALCALAAAMYVMSSPIFAYHVNKSLDIAYKPQLPPKNVKAAVVVLAGGSSVDENGRPFQPSAATMERLYAAVKLSKEQPSCSRLIFSGGDVYGRNKVTEAEVMKYAAQIMGCRAKIILEDKSRNTDENLKYSAEIIEKLGVKHVVVVTNNFHIERAMDFAYQYMPSNVRLYAYPSGGAKQKELHVTPEMLMPSVGSLSASCTGIKEWIGIAVANLAPEQQKKRVLS